METLDRRLSHSTALIVAIAVTAGVLLLAGSVALGMLRPDAWGRSGPDDSTNLDYSAKSAPLGRLSDEYVQSQSGGEAAGAGSSSAKVSRSGESLEGTIPRGQIGAGPPVWYTDRADDAYGPWMGPNAAVSQTAFDILRVDWAPMSGAYSTSITVAGAARDDGWYVSYGYFPSDVPGENCQLYHIIRPGTTAFANAFCGSNDDGTRRFIGRVEGGQVSSTPTAAGGTLLGATFDNRALPALLQAAGRTLYTLSAFTCPGGGESKPVDGFRCGFEVLDQASSNETYRV